MFVRLYGFMLLLIIIASCESTPVIGGCGDAPPKEDCFCTAQFDPVCGCDGKVYGNPCEAACSNIYILYKGECGNNKILGKWNYLGSINDDKVNLSSPSKNIAFDKVAITFDNSRSANDLLSLSSISSINYLSGEYTLLANNQLKISNMSSTYIEGSADARKFENQYIDDLKNVKAYRFKNDLLIITTQKEGSSIDEMVFQKAD
jgi:hypothetical protein